MYVIYGLTFTSCVLSGVCAPVCLSVCWQDNYKKLTNFDENFRKAGACELSGTDYVLLAT